MRIGMMADLYKPHLSGVTNYIDINKRYLESIGHEVFVFTFGDVGYDDGEQNVVRSPGLPITDTGFRLNFFYTRKARQLLESMDVVHVHHPFITGIVALRYCQPRNIPIVFTNHTRYDLYAQAYAPMVPGAWSAGLLEAYMPPFCSAVDLVISPSQGMADVLRRFKVETPIDVVPNGVDIGRFRDAPATLDRSQLGFAPGDILLIYAGRVAFEKNLRLLIDAFSAAAQAVENIQLIILGSGPALDDTQKWANNSNVTERIRFLGRVDYALVPSYMAMCDAFVTTSVTEVHPLSVIEAMAAGLPVVGIHSPGVSDTVEHGVTGLLSTNDPAAFAAQLTRLCFDKAGRKRMATAARRASLEYDISRTAPVVLERYERLVQNHGPHEQGISQRLRTILERFRQ